VADDAGPLGTLGCNSHETEFRGEPAFRSMAGFWISRCQHRAFWSRRWPLAQVYGVWDEERLPESEG